MNAPPVFIVGCPRSGTTALAVMLARHPSFAVPPETHWFSELAPRLRRARRARTNWHALIENDRRMRDLELPPETFASESLTDDTTAFLTAMRTYAARLGKPRWAEKTPNHLMVANQIRRRLPDARFVALVRDGRDTALSLQRVPWHWNELDRNALFWCRTADRVLELEHTWPASQFLRVHYEELIERPQPVLERVCAFLDESFDEAMLDQAVQVATVPAWERDWKGKANGALDPSRIGAWKRQATPEERALLNGLQGPELRKLGYGDLDEAKGLASRFTLLRKRLGYRRFAVRRLLVRTLGPMMAMDFT